MSQNNNRVIICMQSYEIFIVKIDVPTSFIFVWYNHLKFLKT